ncbi:MAG TPA: hypothetical protein VEC08_00375 [Nitrososphaerales archaeon]|nr:hypothetical protein [Nitrososphaerales archaeon]
MAARTIREMDRCEYCGKRLEVQSRDGENVDGNRVVLEIDGSRRRACRSCADSLSTNPTEVGLQKVGRK